MRRSFKYRLYPTPMQAKLLAMDLETHRRLYNACLAQRIASWECEHVAISFAFQWWWFSRTRKTNTFYARLNVGAGGETVHRLTRSYDNFFRRVHAGELKAGFPKFKSRDRFNSFTYPHYGNGIKINANKLYVQNVGKIKARVHRPCEGVIKTATLKIEGDKWYLILSCDLGEVIVTRSENPPVGIDMGVEHFLTASTGEHVPNPRFQKRELPKMRRAGRAVARKKKRGSNRRKAVVLLHRIHAHIANQRRDHHHKTALNLCRRYGTVALESLAVANMVKNRRLARSISDAGWSAFAAILRHHGQKAGVEVIAVNPSFTSQMCSNCGEIVKKTLSERQHVCPCGCSLQRDVNAARNILARGLARAEPTGRNVETVPRVPRSHLSIRHHTTTGGKR